MVLSEEQFEYLNRNPLPDSLFDNMITRGAMYSNPKYIWPSGIVYFRFDAGFTQQRKILDAMNYFRTCTDIEFRPVTHYGGMLNPSNVVEPNYVTIYNSNSCRANQGMIGEPQGLWLDPSWATLGNAIHELGHTVAMIHEQSKRGANKYINVIYDNVKPEYRQWFQEEGAGQMLTSGVDFSSLMLYPPYNGFAINQNQPTMTKKDGSTWTPQTSLLSEDDIFILKSKYKNAPCNKVIPFSYYY